MSGGAGRRLPGARGPGRPHLERKKERKIYARLQACVKGALASKSHRGPGRPRLHSRQGVLGRAQACALESVRGVREGRAQTHARTPWGLWHVHGRVQATAALAAGICY